MNRRSFITSSIAAASALALDAHGTSLNAAAASSPVSGSTPTGDLSQLWQVSEGPFPSSLAPGPGFSFSYDGRPAPRAVEVTEQKHDSAIETTFRYASGIEVVRTAVQFPEAGAIEYSTRIRNAGSTRSAPIQNVFALNLLFGPSALYGARVVSSGGGTAQSTYPPSSFRIADHYLGASIPADGQITLTTRGGRSSNLDLPFYFIHNDEKSGGVFVAIGWTGQWQSTVSGSFSNERLVVTGGIPGIDMILEPGEEITGPRILLGSYAGALHAGSNRLRKLVRERYTPKLDGHSFKPISTYDSWWYIGEHYDETLLRRLADKAVSLGQEYFLLDAAWYVGSDGPEGFSGGLGNWEQVDRTKFPRGLEHFADYTRSIGLKFGLWFEPERVARGSFLARQHPDWVIWMDGSQYGLLDYGREEVREWAYRMLDQHISRYDIRYIRHDFNIDPLPYWNSHDTAGRRGLSQIRHIEGFYTVIDRIRTRHPKTVLECCASGGRRIDLETARRFHTFWISDYTVDPLIVRFHLQGINNFLPANYHYVQYTLPMPSQKGFTPTNSDYLCFFTGAMGTGGRTDLWPSAQIERFAAIEKLHEKIRPYLMENYYPLLPQSRNINSWDASQFHDPNKNEGYIQVFRGKTKDDSVCLALFGLDPHRRYEFRAPLDGWTKTLSGESAMREGIEIKLKPRTATIALYSAV